MFKLFKRPSSRVDAGAVRSLISDARMQMSAMGKLPGAAAAVSPESDRRAEYIAEAGTPSEDVWAREQASYRAKNDAGPSGSA
jgi:hypothetical protein